MHGSNLVTYTRSGIFKFLLSSSFILLICVKLVFDSMLLNTNYLCLAVLKELNFEKEHKLYTFKVFSKPAGK